MAKFMVSNSLKVQIKLTECHSYGQILTHKKGATMRRLLIAGNRYL